MANHGRKLSIFFADGNPTGIRQAEIINWTGQAIACPRVRISELAEWDEARRVGIYFLFGGGETGERNRAYVGESEQVLKRLGEQLRKFEFWTETVFFTNKDENLTKAHGQYLERKLIERAKSAGRFDLVNENDGFETKLPRADRATMEEFLDNIRMVLGALGYLLLEPLAPVSNADTTGASIKLHFKGERFGGEGFATDDGFVVLADAAVCPITAPTLPAHLKLLRESAADLDRNDSQKWRLTRDTLFNSSSAAAGFLAGSNRSGPDSWKSDDGRTLKQIDTAEADTTATDVQDGDDNG